MASIIANLLRGNFTKIFSETASHAALQEKDAALRRKSPRRPKRPKAKEKPAAKQVEPAHVIEKHDIELTYRLLTPRA